MKESGIDWIGQIPEEWEVDFVNHIFEEHKQKNKGNKEKNLLSLSYGHIIRKSIDTSFGLLPESFDTYNIIQRGDIVLRLTDLQNDKRSLRVGLTRENGIITSAYLTLRLKIYVVVIAICIIYYTRMIFVKFFITLVVELDKVELGQIFIKWSY